MSPEEIAWSAIEQNIYNVPTNGQLKRLIAAAIREAVADERDACAKIARAEWEFQRTGHHNQTSGEKACDMIEARIRARSEKVYPDVVKSSGLHVDTAVLVSGDAVASAADDPK